LSTTSVTFKPFRVSSLYHKQLPLAKKFITDEQGWLRVERFAEPEFERRRAETGVVLSDISHIHKVSVKGKDTLDFINQKLLVNKITKTQMAQECNLPDNSNALCCSMTPDEALLLSASDALGALKTEDVENCVHSTDVTSFFAGIYFLGPQSREVVSKLTELDIRPKSFGNLSVQFIETFHVQGILLRVDLNGLLGYWLFFDRGFGEYLWDRIIYAGKEFSLGLIGRTALNGLGWRFG
jgi:glycine cleavage system aminomethyltransferase T